MALVVKPASLVEHLIGSHIPIPNSYRLVIYNVFVPITGIN